MRWRPSSEEPPFGCKYILVAVESVRGGGIRAEAPLVLQRLTAGLWGEPCAMALSKMLRRPHFTWEEVSEVYSHWAWVSYPDEVDYDR